MLDDAECLRRYAHARDEAAFSAFVRQNVDLVYSAAFRQTHRDAHLAEDITQRVFTAAARKAAALSRHPVVRAWLYQTTRYTAIDAARSRRRRQEREEVVGQMSESDSPASAPATTLNWDQLSPELDHFVSSLRARDREAVILRFFGGKSFAEIGAQLRVSESAARMRVDRALEKLRVQLARRGITSTCAALAALVVENSVLAAPSQLVTTSVAAALSAPAIGGLTAAMSGLKFMATAKTIAAGATLIALASLVTAVHEYRVARGAQQTLAQMIDAQSAQARQASFDRLPAGPRALTARVAANAASAGEPPLDPTHAVTAPGRDAAQPKNSLASVMDVLNNPAMQQQTLLQARARLDGQYGSLFKQLDLAPDRLEQFKSLLVEKEMAGFDGMTAAHQQGVDASTDPRGFFIAVGNAQKAVDGQIAALLGSAGYGDYQQYEASVPARNTLNSLRQSLSYTATPLTDDQSARVTSLLAQYGKPALPPGNPFAVLNGDLGIIALNDQGLAQVQGILSPPQMKQLTDRMQQQEQLLHTRERMGK